MILSTVISQLCEGMVTSIEIFLLTLLFSIPLGLLIAGGRMSKFKPLQWLMKIYISIMRGTPLMLQLIVVFFGPYYIFGMTLSPEYRMVAVIIAFSINYAAYFAEIYNLVKDSIRIHSMVRKILQSAATSMVFLSLLKYKSLSTTLAVRIYSFFLRQQLNREEERIKE